MVSSITKCPVCGKVGKVIKSNNPIVASCCTSCLNNNLNYKKLEHGNFFCRTYNLPWDPNLWCRITKEEPENIYELYVQTVSEEYPNSLYDSSGTDDKWEKMDKEWQKCLTFEELLEKIKPIKDTFLKRMQIKWGPQYSFSEYINLEHLYTNTLQSTGTTNPLTVDIIKNIAVTSVLLSKALFDGDIKGAAELSKLHKNLIDSAGLEDMVDVGSGDDVIYGLSDLADYLESKGFQPNFYDNVERDIVDKTIKDQQEWMINFVRNDIGIKQTYDMIEDTFKTKLEREKSNKAYAETSIEELLDEVKAGINKEVDDQLDNEDFDLDIDEDE